MKFNLDPQRCLKFVVEPIISDLVRLDFTKMNGAGNDFILVDNRDGKVCLSPPQIVRLCNRQRGVGADGLLILIPCESGSADWAWAFYNSDGSTAEMCGNGARCFARYIQKLTGVRDVTSFETGAGVIRAAFAEESVTVSLTPPSGLRLSEAVSTSSGVLAVHSVNTGVPHAVVFVPDVNRALVDLLGRELRSHSHFSPRGTNVNFVEVKEPSFIRVRTYERGVETETLACGTGVTAAALIASRVHAFPSPVKVLVQSGEVLEVTFELRGSQFCDVRLSGPADFTFSGVLEI